MVSQAAFLTFIRGTMQISATYLPDASPDITSCYTLAIEIVSTDLNAISPTIYALAVYNLAGDFLINYANDQSGQTYFADLRAKLHIFDFVPGVLSSTSDGGTSQSMNNPEFMKNLMLSDLQSMKTVYGRQYLAFAQRLGTMWGMS
jgi:hypothetical protein